MLQKQDAIEVIDFVAEGAREQIFAANFKRFTGQILRATALVSCAAFGSAGFVFAEGASEVVDLSGISVKITAHLHQGVTSKFLQKSIGEDKSNHGLGGNSSGGDHTPIGTFIGGLYRFLSDHVGGFQRAAESGDRFQVAANNHVFAIGDAAFEAACTVRRT